MGTRANVNIQRTVEKSILKSSWTLLFMILYYSNKIAFAALSRASHIILFHLLEIPT